MVDIANFRFRDPGQAFDEGYGRVNALRTDRARMVAGNALTGGNYGAAAGALYGAGDLAAGARVQGMGEERQAAAAKAQKDREDEIMTFTGEMAGRLSTILDESQDDPNAAVGAFDTFFAPRLQQLGESPEEIAQAREQLAGNARQTVLALGAGAAKQKGLEIRAVGDEVFALDPMTGQVVARYRGSRTVNIPEGGALYEIPGQYGQGAPQAPPAMSGAPMPQPTPQGAPDALFEGMVQQESGGRAGVLGPPTPYGRAEGRTQMLPATAEEMARKIGLPWRPDLMRGDTPAAADYQNRLGRAYLDEGLEKYGGDPEKALMYYHGGPDESLWGPKTRAYAQSILSKVGPQLQGGAGQDQLAGGGEGDGPRLLVSRPKAVDPMKALQEKKLRNDIAEQEQKLSSPGGNSTESERTAGFLASRLADSLKNLTAISGRSPEAGKPNLMESAAERIPYTDGAAANLVRSADRQQVIANQLDILDAALTLGTGAAYTREQLENYRSTYFPQLLDKPDTVTSKRQKLISLLTAAKIKAGRAAPPELDAALEAAKRQFGVSGSQPVTAPKVGEIRKGYRYKGGNPANPQSWEKAQ
jgi:hypothetical protein